MLVIATRKNDKNNRICHRYGCLHVRRIKPENRIEMSAEQAQKRHYRECKYCAGLQGDARVHKKAFETWSRKKNMNFTYHKKSDTLYIQTEIGFWKMFQKEGSNKYLLYHHNTYGAGMQFAEATRGDFHRQADVKPTESMEKIVEYIAAHDRAKAIIKEDYKKLPRNTRKQKQYYKIAEKRNRRNAIRRVDAIFAALEQA